MAIVVIAFGNGFASAEMFEDGAPDDLLRERQVKFQGIFRRVVDKADITGLLTTVKTKLAFFSCRSDL
ncbi:MAG: hypothetical protein WDO15_19185 [Bacteroidota bacterium]